MSYPINVLIFKFEGQRKRERVREREREREIQEAQCIFLKNIHFASPGTKNTALLGKMLIRDQS